jgi:hypothetical protein
MDKVNYVVACWGESRISEHSTTTISRAECLGYLKAQMAILNQLKHSLAQVTIIHPHWPHAPVKQYDQFLQELDGGTLADGTPIVVLRRPNTDMSYGSWSHAYGMYRQQFDYYIFIEDDYIPSLDNFDFILVDLLEQKQCGYLCTLISNTTWHNNGIAHAGITNGICKTTALEVIWNKYGSLLHNQDEQCGHYWGGQLQFSYPYHYCGLKIDDVSDTYSTPFWYAQDRKILMFVNRDRNIIVPIQYWRANIGPI